MNSAIAKISAVLLIFFTLSQAQAGVIQLPENELPSETVLPKVDNTKVVLNRTIKKAERFSTGVSVGSLMDEMFYNSQLVSVDVRYNTSEFAAWGLRYDQWLGGATTYSDAFASFPNTGNGPWKFSLSPPRTAGLFALRTFDVYYGKVSLGKETIKPIQFSWIAKVGGQKYDKEWLPALQGSGQVKIYFSSDRSLDLEYILTAYQKLDPTSFDVGNTTATAKASSFTKKLNLGQMIQIGFSQVF